MFIIGPGDQKSPAQDDRSNTIPEDTNFNLGYDLNFSELAQARFSRACC